MQLVWQLVSDQRIDFVSYRYIIRQLGILMIVLSASILTAAAWSAGQFAAGDATEQSAMQALLFTVAIGLVLALICWGVSRGGDDFLGRREALLLVALSWCMGAALSAMPYWLWANFRTGAQPGWIGLTPFSSFVSCYFEAMSGLNHDRGECPLRD